MQVLQDFEAPPTIAPRPPTTVANPHIDRCLGSKETHMQSHNRRLVVVVIGRQGRVDDDAGTPTVTDSQRDPLSLLLLLAVRYRSG